MDVKAYLGQVRWLDVCIKQKQEALEEIIGRALQGSAAQYMEDKVQTSRNMDPMGEMAARILDMKGEIYGEICRYLLFKNRIIAQIQSLTNALHVEVLYKRYVQYKDLEKIADETNYSHQYIRRLHGEALRAFGTVNTMIQGLLV